MKWSVIICSRNDNYGGDLNTRATFCFNTMLAAFDEVVYIDWNTPEGKPPLTDDLDIKVNPERLKVIVITPAKAKELMGDHYETSPPCCEVLSRNIGLRHATGDIIVSSSNDLVCPPREQLEELLKELGPGDMITLKRSHTPKEEVLKYFEETGSYLGARDALLANHPSDPMDDYCGMSTIHSINKEILERVPPQYQFSAVCIFSGCGDFQIAHRDTWFGIRGFEEFQYKRNFMDTQIQLKIIMAGGTVKGRNMPPIYHINHGMDKSHAENDLNLALFSQNPENWGFLGMKFDR